MEDDTPVAEPISVPRDDGELPGANPVETLVTVEHWEETVKSADAKKRTLVLQIGAKWCERCPAVYDCISALKTDFEFEWVYSDAADTELTEHFEISKLPAIVMYKTGMAQPFVRQAVSEGLVREAVKLMCPGVFVTDADF